MTSISILFGTESGNSELVADDIAEALENAGFHASITPMEDFDVATIGQIEKAIIITSTYGEGELPATTEPFQRELLDLKPDLSNLRFAAFGLGDSSYETYGNGIDVLSADLCGLGAHQVGETGRHDANVGDDFTEVATAWIHQIAERLSTDVVGATEGH